MKKKRILSWLMAIAIVISSLPISALLPTAVSADENIDDVEAILLVNSLTEQVIEPIDLTVPYTTFSDLGLTVTNDDPGFVTSLHVLAQYYIQEKGATAATINDYIDVNADGTVNTIEGNNGIDTDENENARWISQASSVSSDFTEKEVRNAVYIYGINNAEMKYVARFPVSVETGTGIEATISINATFYTGFGMPFTVMDGSEITVKRVNPDGSKTALTPQTGDYTLSAVTRNKLTCTFNQIGTYEISAQKIVDGEYHSNITYTTVTVLSGEQYAFDQDWSGVYWPNDGGIYRGDVYGYLTGPTVVGSVGQTHVEWKSADESVLEINSNYELNRIEYTAHNFTMEDKPVTITASAVDPDGVTQTKTYTSTVLSDLVDDLSDMQVDEIPDFNFSEEQKQYRFTLNKDITQITIHVTPKGTEHLSELTLKVNGVEYQFDEAITLDINSDEVLNTFRIGVSRYLPGYTNAVSSTTYTIQFYKSASTLPIYDAIYPMARVDSANTSVVDAYTPRSIDEIDTQATWEQIVADNVERGMTDWAKWSYPIVVNETIYIAVEDELRKYDLDGTLLKTGDLGTTVLGAGYTGWIAYGDGMIFVPSGGGVRAYNADDLSPLWSSATGIEASQASAPLLYHNGYIYSGLTTGTGNPPTGGFYCMDVIDEEPSTPLELKDAVWTLKGPSFYWAGACIAGDYLIVPCDTGDVYSIDIEESIDQGEAVIVDTLNMSENDNEGITDPGEREVNARIRSSILYDAERSQIYYSAYSGMFHSATLNSDGTFDAGENNANVKSLGLGVYNNSATMYNGRIYVTGEYGLNVIDATTFDLIYTAPFEDGDNSKKGTLTLTSAYATEENGQQVYMYFNVSAKPNAVYIFADNENATSGIVKKLYMAEEYPQYSTSNVVVADNGSLIGVNDYCAMFCISSLASASSVQQQKDVQAMIDALDDTLTDDNEDELAEVEDAYNALTDGQKGEMNAEKLIALLAERDEKKSATKASGVIDLIDEIGTVTLDSETAINDAVTAYNALTSAQKTLVTNYVTLQSAIAQLSALKIAECERLISAIGTVTLDKEDAIVKARTYYTSLSDDEQKKVDNYDKLSAAEEALEKLKKDKSTTKSVTVTINDVTYEVSEATANSIEKIDALLNPEEGKEGLPQDFSELTEEQVEDILSAYRAYVALTDDEKLFVENYEDFEAALNKLGEEFHYDDESGVDVRGNEVLPWNVKINVQPQTASEEQLTAIRETLGEEAGVLGMYDIHFTDMIDGNEYEIGEPISVKIPIGDIDIEAYETLVIIHVTDDGNYEYIEGTLEGEYIVFVSDDFSQYAIAGSMTEWAEVVPLASASDSNHLWIWITFTLLALGALIILLFIRNKHKVS